MLFLFLLLTAPFATLAALDCSNCRNNPYLDSHMQAKVAPYLLPENHPAKTALDAIFSRSRATDNMTTLLDAGFEIISGPRTYSFVIVARHSEVPGYIFKLYLDSESRSRDGVPNWKWLVRRCEGARAIQKIIKKKRLRYFTAPDKWIYVLPVYPFSSSQHPHPVLLVATDMQLESKEVTRQKWKTGIKRKHLDELYVILKQGYGGPGLVKLVSNVPYTKQGKFAFTDTEDPRADLNLKYLKKYLSKEMQHYWDHLIE